jgi:hypothetical protein
LNGKGRKIDLQKNPKIKKGAERDGEKENAQRARDIK